jgi:AcrR family transcriptional regulator
MGASDTMRTREPLPKPVAGRPRDSQTTATILRTALELGEETGFAGLTVEGLAARSGVAKTTIYRRWPNVWAIVMDAFLDEVTRTAPLQERATARESFAASMLLLAHAYRGRLGKILQVLLGQAQLDEKLREAVRQRWVEPRREVARKIVRHGIERGELRPDLDADVVLDALYGPFYHRLLVPYDESPLADGYVDALVDAVFSGLERRPD